MQGQAEGTLYMKPFGSAEKNRQNNHDEAVDIAALYGKAAGRRGSPLRVFGVCARATSGASA